MEPGNLPGMEGMSACVHVVVSAVDISSSTCMSVLYPSSAYYPLHYPLCIVLVERHGECDGEALGCTS